MTIHEKLVAIQSDLKAPKGQTNSFGKYKYRSCEDILEAVKPLLKEHGLVLTLCDEVVNIGTRFYVKATVAIHSESDDGKGAAPRVAVDAFAREEEEKKGMDGAQITGAASSYARKYALNGLFCIDDTKDADTMDNTKPVTKEASLKAPVTVGTTIGTLAKELGLDVLKDIYAPMGIAERPTKEQADKIIERLKQKKAELSKELDATSQD